MSDLSLHSALSGPSSLLDGTPQAPAPPRDTAAGELSHAQEVNCQQQHELLPSPYLHTIAEQQEGRSGALKHHTKTETAPKPLTLQGEYETIADDAPHSSLNFKCNIVPAVYTAGFL